MCGIFGYSGQEDAVSLVLSGLEKLEYRGYDSTGIATIYEKELVFCKELGKVSNLKQKVINCSWSSNVAIGHTRWATHGEPSLENAHPHFDDKLLCAVVHNGIIENYVFLKDFLVRQGIEFSSHTDSEVISKLIGFFYNGNFLNSVQEAVSILQGSFAIAVIHQYHPKEVVCVAKNSPLVIGLSECGIFISSDAYSLSSYTSKVIYLKDRECAFIYQKSVKIFDSNLLVINKEIRQINQSVIESKKDGFQHYMLKEIFEQPSTIKRLINKHCNKKDNFYFLSEEFLNKINFENIDNIYIIACGSSYHAGLLASYFLESCGRIHVTVETSSEFRYRDRQIPVSSISIVISQSGETADTIAAIEELKRKNAASIIGLVNVEESTMTRLVDECLFLEAGPEISVASTKSFVNQLILLFLIGIKCAKEKHLLSKIDENNFFSELFKLPDLIKHILDHSKNIEVVAKKYCSYEHFFLVGRRYMYPIALEGSLKLKEVAYIDANAYPAGEIKHGPLALISSGVPTLAFCADSFVYDKMLSNLMEIKSRKGRILIIAYENSYELQSLADDSILIPKTIDSFSSVLCTVVVQLISYYIALHRERDIDYPRNLAKSVTVE